jgi:hypothetical protein
VTDTRCPNCDRVFVLEEITDGWCSDCGKKIPEVILKDVRPKKRSPHPVPLPPPPTPAQQADEARETKIRVAGLVLMIVAIIDGLGALAWGTYNRINGTDIGGPVWAGGLAVVVFIVGLVMLNTGGGAQEE